MFAGLKLASPGPALPKKNEGDSHPLGQRGVKSTPGRPLQLKMSRSMDDIRSNPITSPVALPENCDSGNTGRSVGKNTHGKEDEHLHNQQATEEHWWDQVVSRDRSNTIYDADVAQFHLRKLRASLTDPTFSHKSGQIANGEVDSSQQHRDASSGATATSSKSSGRTVRRTKSHTVLTKMAECVEPSCSLPRLIAHDHCMKHHRKRRSKMSMKLHRLTSEGSLHFENDRKGRSQQKFRPPTRQRSSASVLISRSKARRSVIEKINQRDEEQALIDQYAPRSFGRSRHSSMVFRISEEGGNEDDDDTAQGDEHALAMRGSQSGGYKMPGGSGHRRGKGSNGSTTIRHGNPAFMHQPRLDDDDDWQNRLPRRSIGGAPSFRTLGPDAVGTYPHAFIDFRSLHEEYIRNNLVHRDPGGDRLLGDVAPVHRTIQWQIHLGVFSPSQTVSETATICTKRRVRYLELRKELLVTHPHLQESECPEKNHPLSADPNSDWNRSITNGQLGRIIRLDVDRTHSSTEFFQRAEVRHMMERILLMWSLQHPEPSYRQGMNELLAIILIALNQDYGLFAPATYPEKLVNMLNPEHMEADSYSLFCDVMEVMCPYYLPGDAPTTGDGDTALLQAFAHVQFHLLPEVDHVLSTHLKRCDVFPAMYLLRWIRVLFTREFTVEQIMVVWDRLLSGTNGFTEEELTSGEFKDEVRPLGMMDYVCVAMLVRIRCELLLGDPSTTLMCLMMYPPVDSVEDLFDLAHAIRRDPDSVVPRWEAANPDMAKEIHQMEETRRLDEEMFAHERVDRSSSAPGRRFLDRLRNNGGFKGNRFATIDNGSSPEDTDRPSGAKHRKTYTRKQSVAQFRFIGQGYLLKEGGGNSVFGRKSIKKRWFSVNGPYLSYFKDKKSSSPIKNSNIDLRGKVVRIVDNKKLCFEIASADPRERTYTLFASSLDELHDWVGTLRSVSAVSMSDLSTTKRPARSMSGNSATALNFE